MNNDEFTDYDGSMRVDLDRAPRDKRRRRAEPDFEQLAYEAWVADGCPTYPETDEPTVDY